MLVFPSTILTSCICSTRTNSTPSSSTSQEYPSNSSNLAPKTSKLPNYGQRCTAVSSTLPSKPLVTNLPTPSSHSSPIPPSNILPSAHSSPKCANATAHPNSSTSLSSVSRKPWTKSLHKNAKVSSMSQSVCHITRSSTHGASGVVISVAQQPFLWSDYRD